MRTFSQPYSDDGHATTRSERGSLRIQWLNSNGVIVWNWGAAQRLRANLLAFIACLLVQSAASADVVLNAIRTGAYTSDGFLDPHSYLTGISFAYGPESRGMLAFDLSSLPQGTVTAAKLTLQNPYSVNEVGSVDLQLRLHGMPFFTTYNFGIPGTFSAIHIANFSTIGASPLYATEWVPLNPSGPPSTTPVEFNLSGQALADLSAALGVDDFFAFGLRIVKADAEEPKPLQYAFGGTALGGLVTLQLAIEPVPEIFSAGLLGCGLCVGGIRLLRRRTRR